MRSSLFSLLLLFPVIALSRPATALAPVPQIGGSSTDKRTPINQGMLPLNINRSGSYYLVGNLTWDGAGAAITVNDTVAGDNRVSIDLNGFELRRTAAPAPNTFGIHGPGGEGNSIGIVNGTIRGFDRGIDCRGYGLRVERVGFTRNSTGLYTGGGATIAHCTFDRCGTGLHVDSQQVGQTFQGGAVVTGCTAHLCTNAFYAGAATTFTACEAYDIFGIAFDVAGSSTLRNCGGSGSTGARLGNGNLVENCRFIGCLQRGIRVDGSRNRVADNHVSGPGPTQNSVGISLAANLRGNVLSGNTVSNHFTSSVLTNYDIPAGSTGNQLQLVLVEVPQTISWPCTVTLRGNVDVPSGQHGITIASDRVTVDLGGASLSGLAGSLDGIAVPAAQRDLVVRNGTIRGMGNSGIWASNATSGHFQNLIVDQNGQHGLLAGAGTRVESCTVSNNTIGGMTTVGSSQVQSCIAHGNVDFGINAGPRSQVLDCQSSNNRLGIIANDGCEVSRCNVDDNQREGILANNGCWIGDCNARNNGFDAIRVSFSCSVLRNNTNGNGHAAGTQAAIFVGGNGNRIEGNNMSFEDHGIIVSGVNNIVVKNTLKSAALSIVAGNSTGPFVNVAGVGDFSGVVGANSPWANFFF